MDSNREGQATEGRPVTTGKARQHGAKAAVLALFNSRVGETLSRKEIMHVTGLTDSQVRSAVYNIMATDADHARSGEKLEVLSRGSMWRWHPHARKTQIGKRLFEELAVTHSGVVLVQDEDGNVYKVVEV